MTSANTANSALIDINALFAYVIQCSHTDLLKLRLFAKAVPI